MPERDDLNISTWVTHIESQRDRLSRRRCRLHVVDGPDRGSHVVFDDRIRIGAQRSCQLVLSDPSVSGVHCEIRLDERGYVLADLGSTNGTFVDTCRVVQACIEPGTTLRVGRSTIRLEATPEHIEVALAASDRFGPLVGRSVTMRELFAYLARLAPSDVTVLITGETGTGKELVVQALVEAGPRRDAPFVIFDCAATSPSLLESELFGHVRGAFTDARQDRLGVFEQADGGTVLLDEIGELPLELQPKLLRVLESREVRRVGSNEVRRVDVRILTATNRELDVEVSKGAFRKDLYFRLAVAEVRLPPLREHLDDVPLLAQHFHTQLPSPDVRPLEPALLKQLMQHTWPGNARELRNFVERYAILGDRELPAQDGALGEVKVDLGLSFKQAKAQLVEGFERRYFAALLEQHNGNIAGAARQAGVDRVTLHRLINRHGLRVERG